MGRRWLSFGEEVKVRVWLLAMVLLLAAMPAVAVEKDRPREGMLLVHVTCLLDGDSIRTVLAFRAIAGGLKKGYRVALLFDGEGAASLKMGRWFGGHSTPIDRASISRKDREDLAALLATTTDGIPDIYGSLLHFLKGRGLKVYVNKRALELRGIGNEQYDHAAEPVAEEKIVELLTDATAYVAY